MVRVEEVKTRRQRKEFINFPLRLYKGNPCFVPPLYMDEKALFKGTVYDEQAESVFYLAYRENKVVGRIHGILQHVSNEKWGQKRVRFTRFDSIDDQEVANALFNAVETWAKAKGMDTVVGPLGFSDLEREGLLIEGFDQLSTFEEQYNYPYYQRLIENAGYEKEIDWTERKLYFPKELDERIPRLSARMLEKYGLRFGDAKNSRDFVKRYGDKFFEVLDKTYVAIYQSVPFSEKMKKQLLKSFSLIINVRYTAVILDKDDNVVCFGVAFPAIGKALQKSGGRLTLPALLRVLKAMKKPEVIDLALIGVLEEYRCKGVATAIVNEIMNMLKDKNVDHAETNLNLETNVSIQNQWKSFDSVLHKRRRAFVKTIL
ncbi:MAG: GNAT family N-acetyltransferase [Clostridiales bacterium]|nr:GNAT family N-acetyltransferase [Clostridiales bacterium]